MGIITLFIGLVVILSGIFAVANTGSTFAEIAFVIGITLVLLGAVLSVGYFVGRKKRTRGKHTWVMVDGSMSVFLGILILVNLINVENVIPYVLGMWVIYSGMLRIVAATSIEIGVKKLNFIAAMGTGVLLLVVGLLSFFNPIIVIFSTMELIGMFLIVQGIAAVELGINSPHSRKRRVRSKKRK